MSRKLNAVAVLFAVIFLAMVASSGMAQTYKQPAPGPITPEGRKIAGSLPDLSKENLAVPRSVVVAVRWDGKVQLAGSKERTLTAVQRALTQSEQPGVIRDINVLSFERANYLAVQIEKQGTLYLQLVPSGSGPQEIFHIGDTNYLYCSGGCSACSVVPSSISAGTGPTCACGEENQAPVSDCQLHPRRDFKQFAQQVNSELLAIGFQVIDDGPASSEGPSTVKRGTRDAKAGRTDPIKRPNN